MTTRTYTKTIISEKLQNEINNFIPDLLDSITTSGEVVTLFLSRSPTGQEDTTLTLLVNNHVPTWNGYKIWEMYGYSEPKVSDPQNINFDLLPLAIHKVYNKGEEDVFTYYKHAELNLDGTILYSDPVLRTTWTWTHDFLNFPIYAEEKVEWYLQDDSIGEHSKVIPHFFDGLHKIRKGKEVRSTLVDDMQIPVSEMLIYNETGRRATEESNPEYQLTTQEMDDALQIGRDFLTNFSSEFNAFINHRDRAIIDIITNDTENAFFNWVNPYNPPNTIRDYILQELS